MSTSASTTVSMSWLPTARSSASRVSGAELAPLDPTDDEATLCTSVIAHLQDQFAPPPAFFGPFLPAPPAPDPECPATFRPRRPAPRLLPGNSQAAPAGPT